MKNYKRTFLIWKELAEAKKTLREMKTKGLREAMKNKKLADEAVREEIGTAMTIVGGV